MALRIRIQPNFWTRKIFVFVFGGHYNYTNDICIRSNFQTRIVFVFNFIYGPKNTICLHLGVCVVIPSRAYLVRSVNKLSQCICERLRKVIFAPTTTLISFANILTTIFHNKISQKWRIFDHNNFFQNKNNLSLDHVGRKPFVSCEWFWTHVMLLFKENQLNLQNLDEMNSNERKKPGIQWNILCCCFSSKRIYVVMMVAEPRKVVGATRVFAAGCHKQISSPPLCLKLPK